MPQLSKDHTKSLLPYQAVLEACEEEYRASSLPQRDVVVSSIAEKIREAATTAGARVTGGDNLQKVRVATAFWWHWCSLVPFDK